MIVKVHVCKDFSEIASEHLLLQYFPVNQRLSILQFVSRDTFPRNGRRKITKWTIQNSAFCFVCALNVIGVN